MKAAALAILLTWLVTTTLVVVGVRQLRSQVREQIIRRDGEILLALARTPSGGDDSDSLLAGEPFAMFVNIGRLEGILAARMFDAQGVFLASIPDRVREAEVEAGDLEELRRGHPISRFRPALRLGDVFLPVAATAAAESTAVVPAVEVWVPLLAGGDGRFAGAAGFVIEGSSVAREFELLDRRLRTNAAGVLLAALGVTGVVLAWAFRQLERGRQLLARRTEDLQRANSELSQAARVTALGAVTAHLIHGLRNPVSGLRSFVEAGSEPGVLDEEAWRDAMAATRRMQGLIQQVVSVLRDHETGLDFEATLKEVADAVIERARGLAQARSVVLEAPVVGTGQVNNRRAGLLALLLTNLVENAIDATPAGKCVRLALRTGGDRLVAEVGDEGPGVPASARERLFQPQESSKEGGGGLGLAITRQLALALGGTVTLASTGPGGSVFRVDLPATLPEGP